MRRVVFVMSVVFFALTANAQTGTTTVKQATPVMKVDGAGNNNAQPATTNASTEEKKPTCEKGKEGQPCCKMMDANGNCTHHGKAKAKKEAKACCQGGSSSCANHGEEGKTCSHGSGTSPKPGNANGGTK